MTKKFIIEIEPDGKCQKCSGTGFDNGDWCHCVMDRLPGDYDNVEDEIIIITKSPVLQPEI